MITVCKVLARYGIVPRQTWRPISLLAYHRHLKLCSFVLLVGTTYALPSAAQMSEGKGQVLNSETQQPIEDASVTLECRRDNLFHGSTMLRKVTVSANNAGNYEFSGGDVAGCDFGYVNADKSGYQSSGGIHPGYGYTAYSKIPKITYLTPDSEAVMLRLRYITPTRTGNVHTTDGRYSPGHDYMEWYSGFFQAKRIAQTSREKQFVLVSYCDTLEKLYRLFSNEDKSMVAGYAVTGAGNGRFDHAAVVSYCEDR